MGARQKKRRVKTRKLNAKSFFIVSILFFCFFVFGVFIYFSHPFGKTQPNLYEEIYSASSDLHDTVKAIDLSIYESLFKNKISEKDILFLEISPRHEKDNEWEFTDVLIKIDETKKFNELEKTILDNLTEIGPEIRYHHNKISNDEIVLSLYVSGLYTHKIRVSRDQYAKKVLRPLPRVAIIIDDIGYNKELARAFIDFGLPLSLSVLPMAPFTEIIAREANKKGCETLLHLPMEPKGYPRLNPGPGALLTSMTDEEIQQRVRSYLKKVPGLKGVNNHMGSCFSERPDKMAAVLKEIKRHSLFYVDSRTTPRTVAFDVAKKTGVPAAKKSVFIDHDPSEKAIAIQMERLLGMARYSGSAVGIGHPYKLTIEALDRFRDQLKRGYDVVPVSELVE